MTRDGDSARKRKKAQKRRERQTQRAYRKVLNAQIAATTKALQDAASAATPSDYWNTVVSPAITGPAITAFGEQMDQTQTYVQGLPDVSGTLHGFWEDVEMSTPRMGLVLQPVDAPLPRVPTPPGGRAIKLDGDI